MEVDDLFDKLLTSERMEKIVDAIASRTIDKILKMRTSPNIHEVDENKHEDTELKTLKIATTTKYTDNEKITTRDAELMEDVSTGLKLKYNSFTESYSIEKVDNTAVRDKAKSKKKVKNTEHIAKSKKFLRIDNETIENDSKYDKTKKADLASKKAIDYYDDQSNSRDEHGVSSESDYLSNKNTEAKSTKGILGDIRNEKSTNWYLRKEFKNDDAATQRSHSKDHKSILITKVPRRYSSKETKNKFADDVAEADEAKRSFGRKELHLRTRDDAAPTNVYKQYRVEGPKVYVYEKSPSYEEHMESYREADDAESTSEDD